MEVLRCDIDGIAIIEPKLFKDSRGYFFESFSEREFREKVCDTHFVQDSESKSSYASISSTSKAMPSPSCNTSTPWCSIA
ncbi:MAG: dTDP-4-dehydrorhamnose 3,5-epimerase family protein [Alistipes sp.]|nr:dTDP-4-dehydrorhamnose 3,5-epimerase family protein [Alistipes sp.]